MLQSITWPEYFTYLFFAVIAYYLFIWLVFFKAKLSFLTNINSIRSFSVHAEDQPDEVMATAQHIIDEIRPLFNGRENKNELILALQLKLRKYNDWHEPGFRDTLNEFIQSECQTKCSIRLSEDDQRALWITA